MGPKSIHANPTTSINPFLTLNPLQASCENNRPVVTVNWSPGQYPPDFSGNTGYLVAKGPQGEDWSQNDYIMNSNRHINSYRDEAVQIGQSYRYSVFVDDETMNRVAGIWPEFRNGQVSMSNSAFQDITIPSCQNQNPSPQISRGDGNGDSKVDIYDFNLLVSNFNHNADTYPGLDFDNNGKINIFDFNQFISQGFRN